MALLNISNTLKIDFCKRKWLGIFLWGFLMISVILSGATGKFKKGMDFMGGISAEISAPKDLSMNDLRKKLTTIVEGEFALQTYGDFMESDANARYLLKCDVKNTDLEEKMTHLFSNTVICLKKESIGPKLGAELLKHSLYAVVSALIMMLIYVAIRFQWLYGLSAIFALSFDCLSVLFFYLVFGIELSENTVIALLITAAYSINDTVVVFDRIRELANEVALQGSISSLSTKTALPKLINRAVNETLPRTLLTSLSTLISLAILYVFGGPMIEGFVLPIAVGFTAGTFSSIVIAAPFLSLLLSAYARYQKAMEAKKRVR